MFDAVGGRKFIFTLFIVALAFFLVLARAITAVDWMAFVQIVGGTYIAGNIAEKVVGILKPNTASAQPANTDTTSSV